MSTDTTLKEIIAEQEEIFVRRQPKSQRLAEQAKQYLSGGVTSSCGNPSVAGSDIGAGIGGGGSPRSMASSLRVS